MSHYMELSFLPVFYKSLLKEFECMESSTTHKSANLNYFSEAETAFKNNIYHGTAVTYYLNALYEGLIEYTHKELAFNQGFSRKKHQKFADKLEYLIQENILPQPNHLSKLRTNRNSISHWEEKGSVLMGTMTYLQYMFGDANPDQENRSSRIIANLSKEFLQECINELGEVLDYLYNLETLPTVQNKIQIIREKRVLVEERYNPRYHGKR